MAGFAIEGGSLVIQLVMNQVETGLKIMVKDGVTQRCREPALDGVTFAAGWLENILVDRGFCVTGRTIRCDLVKFWGEMTGFTVNLEMASIEGKTGGGMVQGCHAVDPIVTVQAV